MPDVKSPPSCDYPLASSDPTGSPSRCASFFSPDMEVDPCLPSRPLSPGTLPTFPHHGHGLPQYPVGLQGAPFPFMSRCNSSTLLSNLGLRTCSGRHAAYGVGPLQGQEPYACVQGDGGGGGGRPYRSMENLHWNSVADPGMYGLAGGPYRSMESEFVFRCTETSHWYDGPPDGAGMGVYGLMPSPESLAFYSRRGLPRKDLALFPHWLFPGGVDECDGRKGLREKLRLQSARSTAEPSKHLPLRPPVAPGTPTTQGPRDRQGTPYLHPAGGGAKPLGAVRLTSPEEIKQEVLRRLQLRRQNSSPNLALHSAPRSPAVLKASYTTDNVVASGDDGDGGGGPDRASERRRLPAGRLHIPTFEEFKRMRKSADGEGPANAEEAEPGGPHSRGKTDACATCGSGNAGRMEGDGTEGAGVGDGGPDRTRGGDAMASCDEGPPHAAGRSGEPAQCSGPAHGRPGPGGPTTATHWSSPIRTGPAPRSPLQSLAGSTAPGKGPGPLRGQGVRRSSLEGAGGRAAPPRDTRERPSSCCPALLLDGTELSNYGAKIYKMKDGLIGSALDLIMKRCVGGPGAGGGLGGWLMGG
ncbi:translation initiation factor IF-2 [Gadus macrocephalus]|uniref:translation initiation factor IF-2 n=1 Tax=Gadus macrocephalus TaxID=80720 RepID=UPI0028CB1C97|nr:translation initiation factor IF-2 [Gadus macrocephalus]